LKFGWKARPRRPCSPPFETRLEMSRNGVPEDLAARDDLDLAALLDDEQAARPVVRAGHVDGAREPRRDL
jgi:hypothetical protein